LLKLRCAVIGCGRIGCGFDDSSNSKTIRTHAGSYFKNPKTQLVALCDIDKNKLKKYGKKYKIKNLFTSTSNMFKNEQLDCISICTLVDTHLPLVKEASKYGVRGIFLEKPASNSLQNIKKIIEICNKNKITLAIDHQRRYHPFYHYIAKFIQQKKLGTIQLINVYYGAGIANTCSHVFDILRFFFGEVKSLKAKKSKNKSLFQNDPNLDVDLKFTNGVKCILQALDLKHYGICEMDVFGTLGRLRINLVSDNIEYFQISGNNKLDYKKLIPSRIDIKRSMHSAISLGIQNLVDSILTNKTPLCTGKDSYKSLELIIASIKSSKNSKEVHLPLKNNSYKIKSK